MRHRKSFAAALLAAVLLASPVAARQDPPLYYQDPDGKPDYSPGPTKTTDGRDYVPVYDTVPAAKPAETRKPLYYRNPMGLADTSPVPKKDSMGMDYIPVYADEGADDAPGTVRLSPGKIQTLGVRTATVEARAALARTVRATGTVRFDERHLATVTAKAGGWIERLDVAAEGDPVARGQVLAELYSPDLVAAEEEYLVAALVAGGGHDGHGGLMEAAARRLRALDVPDDEIARLRRTGASARRVAIRAVRDGVVIEKLVQDGMRIAAGDPLYRTADMSTVWLIAEVREGDLGAIRPGQTVTATFAAFPGRAFDGTVDFIYPALTPETRTARVRIVVPNPDRALRAAMYASVSIAVPAGAGPVISVPDSALVDGGERQFVLIALGEGRFAPRPVRTGARGDGAIEILDGLAAGEQVVVGANFLIDAESNLRTALRGFASPAEDKKGAVP